MNKVNQLWLWFKDLVGGRAKDSAHVVDSVARQESDISVTKVAKVTNQHEPEMDCHINFPEFNFYLKVVNPSIPSAKIEAAIRLYEKDNPLYAFIDIQQWVNNALVFSNIPGDIGVSVRSQSLEDAISHRERCQLVIDYINQHLRGGVFEPDVHSDWVSLKRELGAFKDKNQSDPTSKTQIQLLNDMHYAFEKKLEPIKNPQTPQIFLEQWRAAKRG